MCYEKARKQADQIPENPSAALGGAQTVSVGSAWAEVFANKRRPVKGSTQAFLSPQGARNAWAKNQNLKVSAFVLGASF